MNSSDKDGREFSADEIAQLRAHRIEIFANRVIYDAQPPLSAEKLAVIQGLCGGEIPRDLLALWNVTAGGRLAYDLTVRMDENEEAVSWSELFYEGSGGYRDLIEWIEHERELAQEAHEHRGETWNGKLGVVPIGGFEYCDRIYVVTDPDAADFGRVLAWKQGLPPAWRGNLHQDAVATVAEDLFSAFRELHLETDPLSSPGDYSVSDEFLDYLSERQEDHGMQKELADKLIAFYRCALVDWRTPLADGTLSARPELVRLAIREAIGGDDAELVGRLADAGVVFDGAVSGSHGPTSLALARGAYSAAMALIRAGAPVAEDALDEVHGNLPPELADELLRAGARPSPNAMANCVAHGAIASAHRIAAAMLSQGVPAEEYDLAAAALLEGIERDTAKVRAGRLHHYLGLEGLELHANRLREFKFSLPH